MARPGRIDRLYITPAKPTRYHGADMTRPIEAVVDRDAMRHNLSVLRAAAQGANRPVGRPATRVWAVVKAAGYGHGLQHVLASFADADGLALLEPDAAVWLREHGWTKPILLLEGAFDAAGLRTAIAHRLTVVVHHEDQLGWCESVSLDRVLNVYLKMNSGMNRLGFAPRVYRDAWQRLRQARAIDQIGLMTHFANADGPLGVAEQWSVFESITAELPGERSLSNSAAALAFPHCAADWIRPGIALYGASPFATRSAQSLGLRPAMTLRAALISIQDLAPGASVGYGASFTVERPMRLGIVACGYADGYPRHAPTGTPVWVNGRRARVVGRVSMDMLSIDLSADPQPRVGDWVELWGAQLPIDEVAAAAGTIGYELMCAVAPRVPLRATDSVQLR